MRESVFLVRESVFVVPESVFLVRESGLLCVKASFLCVKASYLCWNGSYLCVNITLCVAMRLILQVMLVAFILSRHVYVFTTCVHCNKRCVELQLVKCRQRCSIQIS